MMKFCMVVLATCLLTPLAYGQTAAIPAVRQSLTIELSLSSEGAMVADKREIKLPAGISTIEFGKIPAGNDLRWIGTGVFDDGIEVLDTHVQPMLAAPAATLLKSLIGKPISLLRHNETPLKGTLLSTDGAIFLQTPEGIAINPEGTWVIPSSPDAIHAVSHVGLGFTVHAPVAGAYQLQASYLAPNLEGQVTHIVRYDAAAQKLSLHTWIAVTNNSGIDFAQTAIKIQDIPLPGVLDLPDGSTRYISYLSRDNLPARVESVAYQTGDKTAVHRVIRLPNSPAAGLGEPLPGGKVEIWGPSPLHKDVIVPTIHTAIEKVGIGGKLQIVFGDDAGAGVERTVTRDRMINPQTRERTVEFKLFSRDARDHVVSVVDSIPFPAKITDMSQQPISTEGNSREWKMEVPAKADHDNPVVLKYVYETSQTG